MDLRVERTYKLLIESFTKLLERKPYESITIAELCDQAMIRRTTFYKHFADKDEFFLFFVKSLRDEFAKCISDSSELDPIERCTIMLEKTFLFLREHESIINNALTSSSTMLVVEAIGEVIRLDMLKMFRENTADVDGLDAAARQNAEERDPEMFAAFLSGGIVRMVREWCATGRTAKTEERAVSMIKRAQLMYP